MSRLEPPSLLFLLDRLHPWPIFRVPFELGYVTIRHGLSLCRIPNELNFNHLHHKVLIDGQMVQRRVALRHWGATSHGWDWCHRKARQRATVEQWAILAQGIISPGKWALASGGVFNLFKGVVLHNRAEALSFSGSWCSIHHQTLVHLGGCCRELINWVLDTLFALRDL